MDLFAEADSRLVRVMLRYPQMSNLVARPRKLIRESMRSPDDAVMDDMLGRVGSWLTALYVNCPDLEGDLRATADKIRAHRNDIESHI